MESFGANDDVAERHGMHAMECCRGHTFLLHQYRLIYFNARTYSDWTESGTPLFRRCAYSISDVLVCLHYTLNNIFFFFLVVSTRWYTQVTGTILETTTTQISSDSSTSFLQHQHCFTPSLPSRMPIWMQQKQNNTIMWIEQHDDNAGHRRRRNCWESAAAGTSEIIVVIVVSGEGWIDSIELNTDSWNWNELNRIEMNWIELNWIDWCDE